MSEAEIPAGNPSGDPVQEPADGAATSAAPATTVNSGRQARWRRVAAGLVGVLLLGATGAVAAGASFVQPDPATMSFAVPEAAVPAGRLTATCPGPPRLLGGDIAGVDPEFSPTSETARTQVSAFVLSDLGGTVPGSSLSPLDGGDPLTVIQEAAQAPVDEAASPAPSGEDGLTERIAGIAKGTPVDGPSILSADALGSLSPVGAGLLTFTASDGDLQGLATARCQPASSDFWLLGASTTVGVTSVLELDNPSETPATVDLELVGSDGAIDAAGTRGLLVPPGASRQIVLGGLATDQERLAVRVTSVGGRVSGVIQQSVLRGITPGGVDILQPAAPAAPIQVTPGISIQNRETAKDIRQQEGYATAAPELQVLVPGSSDAVLDIKIFGPDGEESLPGGGVITAAAGTVSTIPLDSLPEGNFTVSVTSDVSITTSVRVSRGTAAAEPVDFGFAGPTGRLGSNHAVVFARGAESTLVFGVPAGRSIIQLTPVLADGSLGTARDFDIAGGTTAVVSAGSLGKGAVGALVSVSGDAIYGAQLNELGGAVAGVSVSAIPPADTGQQSLPVTLGY